MYPITFVSLGPGEAELITLKGLKTLQLADRVFYPATISKEGVQTSRALDILSELDIDTSKLVPFHVPMSKDRSLAIDAYNAVSEEIKEQYKMGQRICVVAEGDSGFYSSIQYIFDNLSDSDFPVERIAGIPAFIASGALAKIHIVKQEEELNVVPGIISASDLKERIESGKVVVIMKVSQCAEAIKECISEKSDATYHYFENVGVDGKEYYTKNTSDILDRKIPYFSLMIIHK